MSPRTKRILKRTGLGIVAFLVFVIIINAFDESLGPEAKALLAAPKDIVQQAENGYYYHVGMDAPQGASPHKIGMKLIQTYNKLVEKGGHLFTPYVSDSMMDKQQKIESSIMSGKKIEIKGDLTAICNTTRNTCLDSYIKNKTLVRRLLKDNALLVQRAKKMRTYAHYSETSVLTFGMATPKYSLGLQRLLLAEVGLDVHAGRITYALKWLEGDARFWCTVMAETKLVIGKMVGAAYLEMNQRLLSEIIRRYPLNAKQRLIASRILKPLNKQELSSKMSFEGERSFSVYALKNAKRWAQNDDLGLDISATVNWLIETLFYKPNATANLYIKKMNESGLTAASEDGPLLLDYVERRFDIEINRIGRMGLGAMYNPVGKYLIAEAVEISHFVDYAAKVHNLECTRRLIAVQLAIKYKNIQSNAIPAYLASLPHIERNPYNNNVPVWEVKNKSLSFMCMTYRIEERKTKGILSHKIEVRLK